MGFLSIGCSPDSLSETLNDAAKANHPPLVRSVTITPTPLVLGGPVSASADVEDADGNSLTLRYRWLLNGIVLPDVTTSVIASELLKRGDYVRAEVVVSDGFAESPAYLSDPVVVINSRPIVNLVTLEIEGSARQAHIRSKVESIDPDGDIVQYTYRWWQNDKLMKEGIEGELSGVELSRKDSIVVEVTPHDDEGEGLATRSSPLIVGNESPEILSKPVWLSKTNVFEYRVEARDSDGDALIYALETAPPGMTIDKESGQIIWNVGADMSGRHRVKVLVSDGQGGGASQEFELAIPRYADPTSRG